MSSAKGFDIVAAYDLFAHQRDGVPKVVIIPGWAYADNDGIRRPVSIEKRAGWSAGGATNLIRIRCQQYSQKSRVGIDRRTA